MSNQRRTPRATQEQWADLGAFASGTRACVLELLGRIEALEAQQWPQDKLDRLIAQDEEPDQFTVPLRLDTVYKEEEPLLKTFEARREEPLLKMFEARRVVEGTFVHGGKTYRFTGHATPETNSSETLTSSSDSLVDRVADAIVEKATSAGIVDDRPARAAIRQVAAWLRTGRMLYAAELLEQEVDRG